MESIFADFSFPIKLKLKMVSNDGSRPLGLCCAMPEISKIFVGGEEIYNTLRPCTIFLYPISYHNYLKLQSRQFQWTLMVIS